VGITLADQSIDEACTATGLNDFGPNSFREGLDVYCEAVTSEAQLNNFGQLAIGGNIVGSLSNRLKVIDWTKSHPEVLNETVEAPLVVIGMFRAGTTLLSYLLERDPANRALLRWESADSIPPPTAEGLHRDPRIEASRFGNDFLEQLNPLLAAIHHEEPDGPTECISVMGQDFKSLAWEAISNVPSYGKWLLGADQRSAYDYHRLVLQVLQSGGARGRWTLKSPHHALALEPLTATYPDARLVLLHRDPVELCASVCSLIRVLSSTFSSADHRAYIAERWVSILDESITRIDSFRDAHPEFPIIDVHYNDLVRDPLGTAESILGSPLEPKVRVAMAEYLAANTKGSRGAHSYGLAEFGLEAGTIRERFAGYVERYQVATRRHPGDE
jgi:Sulfotransferase family